MGLASAAQPDISNARGAHAAQGIPVQRAHQRLYDLVQAADVLQSRLDLVRVHHIQSNILRSAASLGASAPLQPQSWAYVY